METFLIKALQLILSFSILVIIHECGHFLFSRLFKVRVEKFYLFFNPWFTLFKFKPKNSDTEYGIGWLPLGGYVKIAGMIDESMDKEQLAKPVEPWEFRSKPAWQRLLIMIGGVMFNLILAFVIYSMVVFAWGEEYLPMKNARYGFNFTEVGHEIGFRDGDKLIAADGATLDRFGEKSFRAILNAKQVTIERNGQETTIDMPGNTMERVLASNKGFFELRHPQVVERTVVGENAAKAGLLAGDSITHISGKEICSMSQLTAAIDQQKGKSTDFVFFRAGACDTLIVPVTEGGKVGIQLKMFNSFLPTETASYSLFESFPRGAQLAYNKLTGYVSDMKHVFSKEGAKSIGGFAAIGSIFPSGWDWQGFWNITAFLSVALAFMNILPIPALDGGHVLFLLYEVITGRKPSEKFMEYAQWVGMILLLALMLYANGMDIVRFFR